MTPSNSRTNAAGSTLISTVTKNRKFNQKWLVKDKQHSYATTAISASLIIILQVFKMITTVNKNRKFNQKWLVKDKQHSYATTTISASLIIILSFLNDYFKFSSKCAL